MIEDQYFPTSSLFSQFTLYKYRSMSYKLFSEAVVVTNQALDQSSVTASANKCNVTHHCDINEVIAWSRKVFINQESICFHLSLVS